MTTLFPEEQILKRMAADNPWWSSGRIFTDYDEMQPRMFLPRFMELLTSLPSARSIILLGPRRIGKTVMLFHSIRRLLADGVEPRKIVFLSVDTPLYSGMSLDDMLQCALKATRVDEAASLYGYYVFFDEIQYLQNWESHLKVMCDSYRHVRFVASGSAAAALKMKSIESGAGRFTHFSLPPLLFCEYLRMVGAERVMVPARVDWFGSKVDGYDTIDIAELNRHFVDYINYGGYPEVVCNMQIRSNQGRYIKEDIVDKVLLRDLPGLYGISDTRELYRLFIHIVYRSGEEFTLDDLASESQLKRETVRKYIEYLESAFLVRTLHKVDENARRFQRVTSFKLYITNPSIFSAVFAPVSAGDKVLDHLVETAIYSQFISDDEVYYANWKRGRGGEVDLVKLGLLSQRPERAVEIKWTDRFYEKPGELKSLLSFMTGAGLSRAVVTTVGAYGSRELQCGTLQYVPSAVYAYCKGMEAVVK